MKKLLFIVFILATTFCFSQSLNIIPEPAKAEVKQGTFTITPETKFVYAANDAEKSISFFNNYLKKYYGFELKSVKGKKDLKNVIQLNFKQMTSTIPGAYEMNVAGDNVSISGDAPGIFYAIQTLIQLLSPEKSNSLAIQQCNIVDSPRFAYRGLH